MEFRSLQFGSWLGTPDGEILERGVQKVLPPLYQGPYQILIQALELAAETNVHRAVEGRD